MLVKFQNLFSALRLVHQLDYLTLKIIFLEAPFSLTYDDPLLLLFSPLGFLFSCFSCHWPFSEFNKQLCIS